MAMVANAAFDKKPLVVTLKKRTTIMQAESNTKVSLSRRKEAPTRVAIPSVRLPLSLLPQVFIWQPCDYES